ncbi:hypothetical protein DXV76_16375 [Rhodobacteraceae bacterium CCMM004]|nr:hypothetical protein DXV76_16375 [Rhodobacteraceae bacterium CCMM004]
MIAALAMYDRPETAAATDAFWAAIHDALANEGMAAPARLTRGADPWAVWQAPDLVLAQTCGLPYRARLHDRVTLVGTPDYGLPGVPPGHYRSVVVARADDPTPEGGRMAVNDPLSQSGWAAPLADGVRFGAVVLSGAHRASARMVAEGAADLAALDAVTWRDMERFEPELTARLRVLRRTQPTPGLPYISAAGADPAPLRSAIRRALDAIDPETASLLGVVGLVEIPAADYLALPVPPPPPSADSAMR